MALLAIKGHANRGKEVIEILEMFGGKNQNIVYSGKDTFHYYFIDNETGYIRTKLYTDDCWTKLTYNIFTLEDFLEKFPYKVGDKVLYKYGNATYFIKKMFWEIDKVLYELSDEVYSDGSSLPDTLIFNVGVAQLQPYKEETMEKIKDFLIPTIDFNEYCKDKYLLNLGNYEIKEENGKTYAVRKRLEYPNTYEACCDVLKIEYPYFKTEEDGISASTYKNNLVGALKQLLICRDAYWKIAGDWRP